MNRFSTLKKIAGLFVLTGLVSLTSCTKELKESADDSMLGNDTKSSLGKASKKLNVILFIANDVGYECPTFTGGKSYSTPVLDMMSANGIFFTHTYRHPDGSPSRIALYTGKYNFRNYISWGHFGYDQKTFANMVSDAGYKTCFVGKWQLDDGDYGLTQRGWQNYRVFLPFQNEEESAQRIGRYKSPNLYQAGAYLPDSATAGKYSEDMFSDYMCNFIDSNKTKPFLGVYSFNLAATPYVPTPDDPAFATWDPTNEQDHQDKKYQPGMVKYMDKMIGKINSKLQADGLASNTVVMFIEATATFSNIVSIWGPNNTPVRGAKLSTAMWGTLNPLVVYCPGRIRPHTDRKTLIDFTDFLPTIADLAGIPRPTTYGTLDGISFADNLNNKTGQDRSSVYTWWDNDPTPKNGDDRPRQSWVNDTTYKLYDTLNYSRFYNMVKDTAETTPIPDAKLTAKEKLIKRQFINVLQSEHN